MNKFKHLLVPPDTHAKIKHEAQKKGMLMYALVEQKFQNREVQK